jgi:uncharacterized spore protein YtfJ
MMAGPNRSRAVPDRLTVAPGSGASSFHIGLDRSGFGAGATAGA